MKAISDSDTGHRPAGFSRVNITRYVSIPNGIKEVNEDCK
eukprot:gene22834-29008_t